MTIYAFNANRNLANDYHKQELVSVIKSNRHMQKFTLDKPLMTSQIKPGKTEDEKLNNTKTG